MSILTALPDVTDARHFSLEFAEQALSRCIEQARDPLQRSAFLDRLREELARDPFESLPAAAMCIVLGEARVAELGPLVLDVATLAPESAVGLAAEWAISQLQAGVIPLLLERLNAESSDAPRFVLCNLLLRAGLRCDPRTQSALCDALVQQLKDATEPGARPLSLDAQGALHDLLWHFKDPRLDALQVDLLSRCDTDVDREVLELDPDRLMDDADLAMETLENTWQARLRQVHDRICQAVLDWEFVDERASDPDIEPSDSRRMANDAAWRAWQVGREFAFKWRASLRTADTPLHQYWADVVEACEIMRMLYRMRGVELPYLTPGALRSAVLEDMPHRAKLIRGRAETLADYLRGYVDYIESIGQVADRAAYDAVLVETRRDFLAKYNDPSRWSPSRRIYDAAEQVGLDLYDDADRDTFLDVVAHHMAERFEEFGVDDPLDRAHDESEPLTPIRRHSERVGRNEPCPCGSGRKYKKCCQGRE